jgi:pimeloyl-ACP methyl ester carboxylesterase
MPIAAGLYYAYSQGGNQKAASNLQPPIILIHGAGSSHLCWPAELRRLPAWRVLALDLPGHGRSPGVSSQNLDALVDRLVDFLEALGVYQAVFVGHSMGGAVALTLAARRPEHVAALGLIASGAYLDVPSDLVQQLSSPVTFELGLTQIEKRLNGPQTPPDMLVKTMHLLQQTRPSVTYADWLACSRYDLRQQVAGVRVPTWLACGTQDRLTPLANSHFLAARLPDAELKVFPGAGHLLFLEQTPVLAAGLLAFLREKGLENDGQGLDYSGSLKYY